MAILRATALLLLISLCPAAGQTNALLLDTSKSMRPYYDAGLMRDLNRLLYDILQAKGGIALFGFSTTVLAAPNIDALSKPELGDWTYLDQAVDFALQRQYGTVWIVTDNVQSQSDDPQAANTAVFYQELRSSKINRIVVFPLRQPPGRAGLVVYALELKQESDPAFAHQIQQFTERTRNSYQTEPLQMKPLDSNTVELNFVKSNPGNLARSSKEYTVGQNIREDFQAHFKSKFQHLRISDARVEVPSTKPAFSDSSLLKPEKREIAINPERVVSLDPQSESQTYVVTVDLGTVKLKKDPISLWKAAWGRNYEDVPLDVSFIVHVPQTSFKFKDSFLKDYSASTPEDAKATGRIYGMDQLPLLLSETNTTITARNSMILRINYTWWPAIGWFVLFALLTIVLVVFGRKVREGFSGLSGKGIWTLSATTPDEELLSSNYDGESVEVLGERVGSVQKGKFFVPAPGVKLDGGDERARIVEGEALKIQWKERPILLRFQPEDATAKTEVRKPRER